MNDIELPEGILYNVKNGIATITISRAKKMNSITRDMGIDLNRIATEINDDKNVRVVLLTAIGEKAFSTGSDITLLHQYGTAYELRNRQDYCSAIRSIKKPVVTKINGYALGGGLELLLASDIRIVADNSKFAVSEVNNGWTSGSGATQLLARQIGYNKAAELVLTGKMIDANEALRLGFVNSVHSLDEIDNYTDEMLQAMAEKSMTAMMLIKQNLRASQNMSQNDGLEYENDLFAFSMTTDDAKEGMTAFSEKRKPIFK